MTDKTPHAAAFKALRHRLNLGPQGLADYLGLTVHAVRKIENGTRAPSGPLARLVDVLGMVEAMAPALHAAMIPQGAQAQSAPKPKRTRRTRTAQAPASTPPHGTQG